MQKLHLVGFTADFDGLIFSTRKGARSGSFVVPLDARLLKQIADAERRRDGGDARTAAVLENRVAPKQERPESSLTPREMQDRLRGGWTLEEVAAEAGVDADWVARFAAPVLAEIRRVVDRARGIVFDKPRFGESALPLGASVRRNVADRGVAMTDEEIDESWSAWQAGDDLWVVRFAYVSRGREQEAEWLLDLADDDLTARNRLASQLGHVGRAKGRPRPTNPSPPRPAASRSSSKAATSPARRAAVKKALATKAPAKKKAAARTTSAARPAAKTSAGTKKKAAAKRASARKATVKKTPAKQAAARKAPAKKAPAKKAPARKASTRQAPTRKRAAPRTTSAARPRAKKAPARKRAGSRADGTRPAAPRPASPSPAVEQRAARAAAAPPRRPAATPPSERERPGVAPVERRDRAAADAPAVRAAGVQEAPPDRPPAPGVPVRPAAERRPPQPADRGPDGNGVRPPVAGERAPDPVFDTGPRRIVFDDLARGDSPSIAREGEPRGPLPPPPPTRVPEQVREAVASPIGDPELDPPLPGPVAVDEDAGIARIDSRRTSHYVSAPPPRQPVFRQDVTRAAPADPPEPRPQPGPRPRRRSEPLRGR